MKNISRTFLLAAVFVSLLIATVAYHSDRRDTSVGGHAPALTFDSEPGEALRALKGKYVLLCFWSSTNAPSREAVNVYTSWLRQQTATDVGMLAFNFDKSEPLFREIVKRDGLNQELQFRLSDERAARLMRDYHLSPGDYGTLLVAPDGRILAHNPSPDAIANIIKV